MRTLTRRSSTARVLRGDRRSLIDFWQRQQEAGVSHIMLSLKPTSRATKEILEELGTHVLPLFRAHAEPLISRQTDKYALQLGATPHEASLCCLVSCEAAESGVAFRVFGLSSQRFLLRTYRPLCRAYRPPSFIPDQYQTTDMTENGAVSQSHRFLKHATQWSPCVRTLYAI
jgi:hypothetical protein